MRLEQTVSCDVIVWRWLSSRFIVGTAFFVAMLAFACKSDMTWRWFEAGAIIVVPTYICLCGFVNRTRLEMGRNELPISHGPLAWWRNRAIAVDDIRRLFCTVQADDSDETFRLHIVLADGRKRTLVSVRTIDEVHFLQQAIEEHYGISHQRPESGEV